MAASALYACTKCTQRYPFEELSQGQQLCKVRGHRAGGVSFASSRGAGCPLQGTPLFAGASGFGSLWSPTSAPWDPFIRGSGHQVGKTPEGRQHPTLFQAVQEGAGPHYRPRVSGGAE